ncbi:hypothetical protein GCM10010507_47580 [Streptomyces cinnamoneus]|uniref:Uncharacterized protein n=1 Tax=Streptomyces cinnamoneus TaxID=53446 RepID=A0A918TVJ7_STRCJ|nr:hypothetical protein GCM10010507_47580 [Streptomyces cinnamoneus]
MAGSVVLCVWGLCPGVARQAAELLLVLLLDDVEEEDVDEDEGVEEDEDVEDVDFAAGLLLDDAPRLSFR